MSFILDALRKLEEKQARETTRELLGTGGGVPQPAGRGRGRIWAGAAMFLVAMVLVSAWLLLREEHPPKEAGLYVEGAVEVSPPVLPLPGGSRKAAEPLGAVEPAPVPAKTAAPVGESSVGGGTGAAGEPLAGAAGAIMSSPDGMVPFEEAAPLSDDGEEVPVEIADAEPEPPAGDRNRAEASVPPDRILAYEELPEEIRTALKGLRISGHIYSSDPLLRRLNVNDGMWREGDSVPGSATIEEVTERGAVFRYGGYRFSMEVHR